MRCFLGLHPRPLEVVGTMLGITVMRCRRCRRYLIGGIQ